MKIKKSDTVLVTAGKDKGKQGKVEKVFAGQDKVVVTGVNQYKRHTKKRDEQTPGGIIDIIKPLPVANVALICPKCKKPTRVGFIVTKGEKRRVCKKCEQMIS